MSDLAAKCLREPGWAAWRISSLELQLAAERAVALQEAAELVATEARRLWEFPNPHNKQVVEAIAVAFEKMARDIREMKEEGSNPAPQKTPPAR